MSSAISDTTHQIQDSTSVGSESTRKQIRGSSMLLAGRGVSLVINLLTQIAVIRYLTLMDYGAFAWAFAVVELTAMGVSFGMDKSLSRFGAIYHEKGDYRRLAGSLIMTSSVVLSLGFVTLLIGWLVKESITSWWSIDALAISTLMTLFILVPVISVSSLCLSIFAFLNKVQTVFVRRHLVGPLARLACVLTVILMQGGLHEIGIAYLVSGLIAVTLDLSLAAYYLKKEKIRAKMKQKRPIYPVKEIFSYSLPLLTSDLAFVFRGTFVVILLGWLASTSASGSFRAVLSIGKLNELVLVNFSLLFTPLASRIFSRSDDQQLSEIFEKTSIWSLVLSFPLFAACVALGDPIITILFGSEYQDASILLAILASGFYFQAMMGFSGSLLRVLGRVRIIMVLDILATCLTLFLCLLWIPKYEGLGAVLAVSTGISFHTFAKYLTIRFTTPYAKNSKDYNQSFIIAGCCALILLIIRLFCEFDWVVGLLLTVLTSFVVVQSNRSGMNISYYFPEIKRIPILGSWLSEPVKETDEINDLNKNHDHSKKELKLAYMMSRFPKITETFVLSEMNEIEKQGYHINIYPLQREKTDVIHSDAIKYVDRAFFTPWFSLKFIPAHVHFLINSPTIYLKTFWKLLKANWGSMRFFTGAIAFFPKVVYLARQMQKDGITHLHAHFASHPAMAAWAIHQLTRISYSFTAHGSDLHRDQHMLSEKVESASSVIAISEYNRNMILDICHPENKDKIQVVHCGIDPLKFRKIKNGGAINRKQLSLRIACIGTLHEVKGQKYLIEACQILKESGISFSCHFIGAGPDEVMLKELVQKNKLTEQIIFEGRKTSEEIQEILQGVDILVVPSVQTKCGRREGIPVVLMEALGSQVAVVASDISGIPELVVDGKTGLLTKLRDPESISSAIRTLHEDEKLRLRLAEAGHQKVVEEFHLSRNAEALIELWNNGREFK